MSHTLINLVYHNASTKIPQNRFCAETLYPNCNPKNIRLWYVESSMRTVRFLFLTDATLARRIQGELLHALGHDARAAEAQGLVLLMGKK